MTNFNEELLEKVKQTKSVEELLALAGENNMEMTEEQAKAYFAQLHPTSGEMADDELENVAGGGCHSGDGRLVVTTLYECDHWTCLCGSTKTKGEFIGHNYAEFCASGCGRGKCCQNCKYMSYERGLWLCNNPENKS